MNQDTAQVEPLAIVGMACRLPGGIRTLDSYWQALLDGRVAASEIPAERWAAHLRQHPDDAAHLRDTPRRGNFLDDPAGFDAEFFGVTPREAELMDPQQRIVLETTWEALENAGIDPRTLAGTDAGVFMGVGSDDYGRQMLEDLGTIEAWTGVGASCCVVANRVSYLLDLRGPSFAVDAACASSLVAVHLAATALRGGECGVAIVGGVNVIAAPGLTLVLDAAGAISPDGRSKPFDAAADGYGRGEGAGVVVLKRLSDAARDGDRVHALLRGSAVNQDGRTAGIMAPNGDAQAQVVRLALRQAGVPATSVDFVEAHGTGTRAGDPVEAGALGAVFGAGRPAGRPCLIGSVKSNIGHLEAAAGVAGLIKAALALEHGVLPPQAGLFTANPDIDWAGLGLAVLAEATVWPGSAGPRRAGVSSFGYGGTVGHVVLEQVPEPDVAPQRAIPAAGPEVYPLSGASAAAVRALAAAVADTIPGDAGPDALADVRHTLWRRRSHLAHRAAVVAADATSLRYELRRLAAEQPSPGVATGTAPHGEPAGAVWVFSGHGAQWPGMGRELLAGEPVFAAVVDAIDPVFRAEIGFSPRALLESGEIEGVDRIQAMTFVMQVGLAELWRELGLRPSAVIGHSVGEVAAAVAAGVLDLLDGARLICRRSVLLRRVAGAGAMTLVHRPFADVAAELPEGGPATAAVEASTGSTVVAGTPEAVAAYGAACGAAGVLVRPVRSDVAFHTAQVDPLLDDLRAALAELTPSAPAVPLYSTALDDPRSDVPRDAAYWATNLRRPVRFASAVAAAVGDGHRIFLELSGHPIVAHSIGETLDALGVADAVVTGSLRRQQPERATLHQHLGVLYCGGLDASGVAARADGFPVDLPGVVWQHRRFWRETAPGDPGGGGRHDPSTLHLLGARVDVADPGAPSVWRTRLSFASRPYPGCHPVGGKEIVPAATVIATFAAAAGRRALDGVRFDAVLPTDPARDVQVLARDGALRLVSRTDDADGVWRIHATATVVDLTAADPPAGGRTWLDVAGIRRRCTEDLPPGTVMERLNASGIASAALPWTVASLVAGPGELLARIHVAAPDEPDGTANLRWVRAIDAVTSAAAVVLPGGPALRLLTGADHVRFDEDPPERVTVHIRLTGDLTADAVLADDRGRILGRLDGLRFHAPDAGAEATAPDRLLHHVDWRRVPDSDRTGPLDRLVVVGEHGLGEHGAAGRGLAALVADQARAGNVVVDIVDEPDAAPLGELTDRDAVLVLASGGDPADPHAAESAAWRLARTAQRIAALKAVRPPRLWAVTVGLYEGTDAVTLPQSPVWGLGPIIGGEYPDLWGGVVDLAPDALSGGVTHLLAALRRRDDAQLLAPRGTAVLAARLAPLDDPPDGPALRCHPGGTYLVTGGLGVLGRQVATWLATRGARRIVLAGRTGLPPRRDWTRATDPAVRERVDTVRSLEAAGVAVRVVELDVTDAAVARRVLDSDALGLPPIRGVVHAAGALDNRLIDALDPASLHAVMAPKVAGALVLDALYPPGSLDFFVLFSSIGQFLGLPGQAAYAAGNAFLDALARHRRARGDSGTASVCWTSWQGLGMANSNVVDRELRGLGIGAISAEEAFAAWERAWRTGAAQPLVFPVRERDATSRVPPLLSELAAPAASDPIADPAVDLFTGLSPEHLRQRVVDEVARQVGAEMRIAPTDLDPRQPLTSLGLDSLMTLAIRRRLDRRFRTNLPATLVWNHPTVEGIAAFLAERLTAAGAVG